MDATLGRNMGTKHSREQILEVALAAALDDGLSKLSFGRVAKRLGIPDRTVVYYFPKKDELVQAVLGAMGLQLQEALTVAFTTKVADHRELVRQAWPLLANEGADAVFALFFEANGLAATGREPYRSVVPSLVAAWTDWAAGFVEGGEERRRAEAEAAIAVIDGLVLLRLLVGEDAAARAAERLGVT